MTKKKLKKKDKKIAVVQLENQLDYISHLKQLMHHNQDYKPWYEAVTKILNKTFGNASTELMRFEGCKLAKSVNNIHEEQQRAYIDWLNQCESVLKSIIQELKNSFLKKVWYEVKDLLASIIAKYVAQKT